MLIGLVGKIGAGKSTLGNFLEEKLGFEQLTFSKPLKQIGEIFGFSHSQLYGTQEQKLELHPYFKISAREFLQKVGTELFRETLPKILPINNPWIDIFKINYKNDRNTVVSDIRFPDEVHAIHKLGGIVLKINRTYQSTIPVHSSEEYIDSLQVDYVIDNNGSLEETQRKVNELITSRTTLLSTS